MSVSSAGEKGTLPAKDFSGIDFRDGLLRVSVENQKFQKVMDEVAQKAGIEIVINHTADEDLTINFDYLPLEKGLKKLLRGRNYVFVYFSKEASQAARVQQVLVFPKSEERREANIKGSTESGFAHLARQKETRGKMQNVDKKSLEAVLQVFSQGEIDLNEEMIGEIKDLEEMRHLFGENSLQDFPQGGKEFFKALEMIQKMEGFGLLTGFEGKAETSLATQPKQKGSVREMQNGDKKSFDEVLKAFSQGERELNE
jgi:hypothetical protein